MAKYKVTVQYKNKPSTVYETDDKALAKSFLKRELDRAKSVGFDGRAIFWNSTLKWRAR